MCLVGPNYNKEYESLWSLAHHHTIWQRMLLAGCRQVC